MAGRPIRRLKHLARMNPGRKLARKIKEFDNGTKTLWAVMPPLQGFPRWDEEGDELPPHSHGYILISKGGFDRRTYQPAWTETYIFPADSSGEPLDMGELPGSANVPWEPEKVLENIGYEIVSM
jgi:hypothetical protein